MSAAAGIWFLARQAVTPLTQAALGLPVALAHAVIASWQQGAAEVLEQTTGRDQRADELSRAVHLLEDIRNLLAQEPTEVGMTREQWDRQTGEGLADAAARARALGEPLFPGDPLTSAQHAADRARVRVELSENEYKRYLSGALNFCPEGCMCSDVHADVVQPLTEAQLDDFQDRIEAAGVPAPIPAIIRSAIAELFAPKPFDGLRPVPNPQM